MSSSKPLIVVANAFERERKLARQAPARIMWTRAELGDLLGCYGRHVAAGIWRDYAIDDVPNMPASLYSDTAAKYRFM